MSCLIKNTYPNSKSDVLILFVSFILVFREVPVRLSLSEPARSQLQIESNMWLSKWILSWRYEIMLYYISIILFNKTQSTEIL